MVGQLLLDAKAGFWTVENETGFGESLVAFCVDANAIEIVTCIETLFGVEVHLTAKTVFFQSLDTEFASEMTSVGMVVSQEHAVVFGDGIVHESIVVSVHLHGVEAHVAQQQQSVAFSKLESGVEIKLRHGHRVGKEVEKQFLALIVFRLFVVHVDLPANRLESVTNRGSAFGNGDAVHPCARHITQAESGGQTTEVGHILGHHLGVESTEAEQFDLFGAGDGIGIGYIDRGVGLEALSKAAAMIR